MIRSNLGTISLILATAASMPAQDNVTKQRRDVITALVKQIRRGYVNREVAAALVERLQAQAGADLHLSAGSPAWAQRLTAALQKWSGDLHLRVVHRPGRVPRGPVIQRTRGPIGAKTGKRPPGTSRGGPVRVIVGGPAGSRRGGEVNGRAVNHHFRKVEILDGNVGLIDLREFVPDPDARRTAAAAMAFLANADAIIVDLRRNTGGGPQLVQFLSSYFFSEQPVLLNTFYNRLHDQTRERWTLRDLPGKRRPEVPLYILIGRGTFSAAEDFAYSLKHLGRAIIVGEQTRGGGHPTIDLPLAHGFLVQLPVARPIHPVTKKGWEGVGVVPTVSVKVASARDTAWLHALKKIAAQASTPVRRAAAKESLRRVEAILARKK